MYIKRASHAVGSFSGALVDLFVCVCVCVGFQGQDFDWADYLKQCEAEAAPQQCFPPVSFSFCIFGAKALQKYIKHITNA